MKKKSKKGLVLAAAALILAVVALLWAPWKQTDWSRVPEYQALEAYQKASTAQRQLEILYGFSIGRAERLKDTNLFQLTVQIGRGLPDGLIPENGQARTALTLPEQFRDARFVALYDNLGTLCMLGDFYTRLPEAMRARTFQEANAVLYLQQTVSERESQRGKVHDRHYRLYAADLRDGAVFEIYRVSSQPEDIISYDEGDWGLDLYTAPTLWDGARRLFFSGEERKAAYTYRENTEHYRECEDPEEMIRSLHDLAEVYAENYREWDPDYSGLDNYLLREVPARLIPDIETAEYVKELPEKFRNRKMIVLQESVSDDGKRVSMYMGGDFYVHLPEALRAASLEEAEAVLYVRRTPHKQSYGNYYIVTSQGNSYYETVSNYTLYWMDLTDGYTVECGSAGNVTDAELWERIMEKLEPEQPGS